MKYMKTSLANGTHLWKTEDFFALRAEPEDRVEFALHHLQSGKYLQYGSVFSSTSDGALTAESFNVVVDQTVADSSQSSGYTAQTRSVCQRFTFEKVGTGDNAYYHILPYLRLQTDAANSDTIEIKGSYRSEYRLGVVNGAVRVVQIPVTNGEAEDPISGRWLLQQTAGGKYLIKNVSTGTYLSMENNAVCLTQQQPRSTLWTLKAICLNAEKDYQRTSYTCGAASGLIIYNYLMPSATMSESQYVTDIYNYFNGTSNSAYMDITATCGYLNNRLGYNVPSGIYKVFDDFDLTAFLDITSHSLNCFRPAIIHMRPYLEDLETWGYYYSNDGGHYNVMKGLFFNGSCYETVSNDCHYKFGQPPSNKPSLITNNIGGRDIVTTAEMLFKVNAQRFSEIMCFTMN